MVYHLNSRQNGVYFNFDPGATAAYNVAALMPKTKQRTKSTKTSPSPAQASDMFDLGVRLTHGNGVAK